MSCCDPCGADDKEVAGVCRQCEGDINAAGLFFGYLYRKYSYRHSLISDMADCSHKWSLYTDPKLTGNPFVRRCDHCKKKEYYDF